jgi:hypothetical protein
MTEQEVTEVIALLGVVCLAVAWLLSPGVP